MVFQQSPALAGKDLCQQLDSALHPELRIDAPVMVGDSSD